jgi:hypothetical protein
MGSIPIAGSTFSCLELASGALISANRQDDAAKLLIIRLQDPDQCVELTFISRSVACQ